MIVEFDITNYRDDGFAVVTDAVSPAQIVTLVAAIERIQGNVASLPSSLREHLVFERDLSSERRGHALASPVGDAVFIIGDPPRFDAAFSDLLRSPALRSVAEAALETSELVTHFMNVTIKHPCFGRSIAWHRDHPNKYICPVQPRCVRLMLCLDGMDDDSGATTFVAGSHLFEGDVPSDARPGTRQCVVRCNPGDLIVIHPKVLHGGSGNSSARWLRNVVVQVGVAGEPLATGTFESITNQPLGWPAS